MSNRTPNKQRRIDSRLSTDTTSTRQKFSGIEVSEKNDIIKKFIESRGVSLLFGPKGSGKTSAIVKKCIVEQEKSPTPVVFLFDDSTPYNNILELFGENLKKIEQNVQVTTFLGFCRYLIEKLGMAQEHVFIDDDESKLILEKIIKLQIRGSKLFFLSFVHLFLSSIFQKSRS